MVTKDETTAAEELLNKYECILIISPEVADDAIDPYVNNVTQYVSDNGGKVEDVNRWGRKKLAYPIKHMMEGNYVLISYYIDPSYIRVLDNNLKITEKIIRHSIIRIEQ